MDDPGVIGEEKTFNQLCEKAAVLYEDLKPELIRMVERRIRASGFQGRIGVDDVLQGGWVRHRMSLEADRPGSDEEWRGWIRRNVLHYWIDELRKLNAERRDASKDEPIPDGSVLAILEGIGIATDCANKEMVEQTVKRIRLVIKPLDFEIVWMHIVDELSHVQIAHIVNKTSDAVGRRYLRSLEKIREAIASPFTSSS